MFGYHIVNSKKDKKMKKERKRFENERDLYHSGKPSFEKQNDMQVKQHINESANASRLNRRKAQEEGWNFGQDVFNRNVQGLTPEQRKAIQYEASQRINRDTQAAERKLLGEQGRRGIGGKSGVAFAQQQELARAGQDAKGQVSRDTEKLNADLALKKIAAMFSSAQGEAAQSQLDRQMAADEIELDTEKKRQRFLEDKFNRLFSRV